MDELGRHRYLAVAQQNAQAVGLPEYVGGIGLLDPVADVLDA